MIDTAVPEELLVAELQQHCREIIEAELVRLRRVAPTLPESIMIEIDRSLGQVVDGWLLTPVHTPSGAGPGGLSLFGLAPRPMEVEPA